MLDFTQDAVTLARRLVGCELLVTTSEGSRGGIIIETEAYTRDDPASHSFRGKTKRNQAMFSAPGTIYIYKIYGMHHCFNIVCGNSDGQAVLVRALSPTIGLDSMKKRRNMEEQAKLCNGPGNLVQALGIDPVLNGVHLNDSPIAVNSVELIEELKQSARIGITKGTDRHWRFHI